MTACSYCDGKGRILDTTYDRTGATISCGRCFGTGKSEDAIRQILSGTRTITAAMVEGGARGICKARDIDPDILFQLMPGDPPYPEDGHFFNSRGERCVLFKAWRKFTVASQLCLNGALATIPEEERA